MKNLTGLQLTEIRNGIMNHGTVIEDRGETIMVNWELAWNTGIFEEVFEGLRIDRAGHVDPEQEMEFYVRVAAWNAHLLHTYFKRKQMEDRPAEVDTETMRKLGAELDTILNTLMGLKS